MWDVSLDINITIAAVGEVITYQFQFPICGTWASVIVEFRFIAHIIVVLFISFCYFDALTALTTTTTNNNHGFVICHQSFWQIWENKSEGLLFLMHFHPTVICQACKERCSNKYGGTVFFGEGGSLAIAKKFCMHCLTWNAVGSESSHIETLCWIELWLILKMHTITSRIGNRKWSCSLPGYSGLWSGSGQTMSISTFWNDQ